jgi:uncharacterized protein
VKLRWDGGSVTAKWDRPNGEPKAVVVLAHGAGGDLNDPVLEAVSALLARQDFAVLRFNFPYREAGRKAPGSQRQSEDSYCQIADQAGAEGLPLYLGGKSYGGRMASHIVADGFEADGLVFLSYPLHPPGRPERLRDEHLSRIEVPMLFVQGTKDSFAKPELLSKVLRSLPGAVHHSLEKGDHSLRVRGRGTPEVAAEIAEAILAFTA